MRFGIQPYSMFFLLALACESIMAQSVDYSVLLSYEEINQILPSFFLLIFTFFCPFWIYLFPKSRMKNLFSLKSTSDRFYLRIFV